METSHENVYLVMNFLSAVKVYVLFYFRLLILTFVGNIKARASEKPAGVTPVLQCSFVLNPEPPPAP